MAGREEKRFGTIAVEKGYADAGQAYEALKIQITDDLNRREHRPIGLILAGMGIIARARIDEVLKSMVFT